MSITLARFPIQIFVIGSCDCRFCRLSYPFLGDILVGFVGSLKVSLCVVTLCFVECINSSLLSVI